MGEEGLWSKAGVTGDPGRVRRGRANQHLSGRIERVSELKHSFKPARYSREGKKNVRAVHSLSKCTPLHP